MLAGQHGEKIFRDIPLEEYLLQNAGPNGRIKDISKHASNLEFELKFKNIAAKLFTAKAKIMAQKRIIFMRDFFAALKDEINGNR